MSEIFEILMVVSFGASWPASVLKSYRARSAKGKSIFFLSMIFFGYICGIVAKLTADSFKWYVLFFYCLNFVMVALDLVIYVRNYRLDKKAEEEAVAEEEAPAGPSTEELLSQILDELKKK